MRRYLPYILYAVIVVGLVAAIIIAFNADDPASKTDEKKPAPTSERQKKNESGQQTGNSSSDNSSAGSAARNTNPTFTPPAATPSTSGNSSSNTQSQTSATANRPATGSSQQLANSGPGETLAAFVLVTIGATAAFSFYQRRALTA